jgi:hypothetical protein
MEQEEILINIGFPKNFVPKPQKYFQPVAYLQSKEIDENIEKKNKYGSFHKSKHPQIRYGVKQQKLWLGYLFNDMAGLLERKPIVGGISGKLDDHRALLCALSIAYRYIEQKGWGYVVDAGNPQRVLRRYPNAHEDAGLVVIHNVGTKSAYKNRENAQNLLRQFQNSVRLVVSSGCNPLLFFRKYLQYRPNILIYFE